MSQGAPGLNKEELEKLFHIADDLHGRAVPLIPVYDPAYDGEHVPDWADDPDWFVWHPTPDGELRALDGFPKEGRYFAEDFASDNDLFFQFLHIYTQHASWPDLMGILANIEDDLRNLATSMAKMGLYQHLAETSTFDTRRFVITELEYVLMVCRSLYDHLQFIAQKSWDKVKLKDGGKNQLPSSFADIALHDNDPVPAGDLEESYGLSPTLAEFYETEAEEFAEIRGIRDDIVHHGRTFELIFTTDHGHAVQATREPFATFDVWDEDDFLENDLAPLWPFTAHIIHHTITAMNRFQEALMTEIGFPPAIAPGYNVYMTGEYIHNLGRLGTLMEDEKWGDPIVDEITDALTNDEQE